MPAAGLGEKVWPMVTTELEQRRMMKFVTFFLGKKKKESKECLDFFWLQHIALFGSEINQ